MKRRLIWIIAAVAVIGAAGYLAYDRYLGSELRRGQELRDSLAAELASAGFAFTSMEYDWRTRRIVAEGLVATKLPRGITAFSIGSATYRGADPAAWSEAFKQKDRRSGRLIEELTLSDIVIGFEGDVEFKQASFSLKHVGLGKATSRGEIPGKVQENPLILFADMARRLHIGLLEAEEARFWQSRTQAAVEQKLIRLEDYRGGNFSEFRLEGLNVSVAVVVRAKLDEYYVESVKARRFLENLHRTSLVGLSEQLAALLLGLAPGGRPRSDWAEQEFAPLAETGIVAGDTALIGFEMLIPAVGRIAFEEISSRDRQFINGLEVGGKSKMAALEIQISMLTRVLTAALDNLQADIGTLGSGAGAAGRDGEADTAGAKGFVGRPLQKQASVPARASLGAADEQTSPEEGPAAEADRKTEDSESPRSSDGSAGGAVEKGPAAPVPEVWGNEIKPPPQEPELSNREIAEIIRRLGFDNIRIDSEMDAAFDEKAETWTLNKFAFNLARFWNLDLDIQLSGVGALKDLGNVPMNAQGWWTGPKADAVGDRFLREGRFEGLSLTYRDLGFVKRLVALIAERRGVTVEALAAGLVEEMQSAKEGELALDAEGLADGVKAFLLEPGIFAMRFKPAEPLPFSAFSELDAEKKTLSEIVEKLGLELTLNGQTFTDFKKTAAIVSDMEREQD